MEATASAVRQAAASTPGPFGEGATAQPARWSRLPARVRRTGWLMSSGYLAVELLDLARCLRRRSPGGFEQLFASQPDPWAYSGPAHQRRFADAAALVGAAARQTPLGRSLEIGCAEGAFTERLAAACPSVLAVDVAATALQRARARRPWPAGVRFRRWDLWRDSTAALSGPFDLVVVVDVLEYAAGPWAVLAARARLARLVRPGGYLLVGSTLQSAYHESGWWSRWLVRGGTRINAAVAGHRAFETVASRTGAFYVQTLLRRAG